jgi:hypothetical protein
MSRESEHSAGISLRALHCVLEYLSVYAAVNALKIFLFRAFFLFARFLFRLFYFSFWEGV